MYRSPLNTNDPMHSGVRNKAKNQQRKGLCIGALESKVARSNHGGEDESTLPPTPRTDGEQNESSTEERANDEKCEEARGDDRIAKEAKLCQERDLWPLEVTESDLGDLSIADEECMVTIRFDICTDFSPASLNVGCIGSAPCSTNESSSMDEYLDAFVKIQ